MKPILFFCFLLGSGTAFCQTGKLTGSIMDAGTKTPLELATVTVLGQDSAMIAYKLSDKNGKFTIEKLPLKKKLLVSITYSGYIGYNKTIQFNGPGTDTLSVFLSLNNKDTNAIVVTATVPIRMNGDTLEINPAAFKLKQDAVVEELLNQVSGITIWSDGSITVNGKPVQSLLVDGKPFMGSTDSRIATQNLPKSAIEKIQLYQEYDRSKIGQDPSPQDSLLTMNIKLKEGSKNGYFGKAGAGYGTSDRFESDLTFQVYNKKSSAGIGGGFNNINKNIGNLLEMFQNNTYRNYNPNLYNVGRFGTQGINKNHSVGGIYTHDFIETTNSRQNNRISINYNKSGTDTYITDLNLENSTINGTPQFTRNEGTQNNNGNRHDLGINYSRTNSYNDNLNLNGSVNTSSDKGSSSRYIEVRDTTNQLQSTNRTGSSQSRRSDNESLNFSFAKSNFEDPLKNFNVQLGARRNNSESERIATSLFESYTDLTKNSYNRQYLTNTQSLNLNANLDYSGFKRLLLGRYNLFGISLNFTQWINYTHLADNNQVGDYDSASKKYISNSELSNFNKRDLIEYSPSLSLSKSIYRYSDKYSRNISVQARLSDELKTDKNTSSFANRNLTRSFDFLRYEGSLNYSFQKRQLYQYFISAAFVRNFDYPSIDQLYTIVDDINVYNIRIGNPNLRNRINHNMSVNASFYTQNPKSAYSVNSNLGAIYRRTTHPFADSIINDFSGKRTYYYTNADKSSNVNFYSNLNVSRRFGKNMLQLMYNGQYSTGKTPNYIGSLYNISETDNLSNRINLQFSLRTVLLLTIGQSFQTNKTSQTAKGLTSFKNSSNSANYGLVLNYPKNLTFSSTLDRIVNSNLEKPTLLWNAFLTYRFMKQQGELKLSAMDLLKQYQNISNSVSTYGTITRITNGLQQYFLLTFSYYPRKFGKTEIKRQTR